MSADLPSGLAASPPRPRTARRRGAAAVEFALVAPLALLFIFAAVELGRAMFIQMVAVSAARNGCRQGVLPSSTDSTVEGAVNDYLASCGLTSATTLIKVDGQDGTTVDDATPGETVEVTVTIPYADNSLIPAPFFLGNKALIGQVTMSKE